jgi:hypothetical protein
VRKGLSGMGALLVLGLGLGLLRNNAAPAGAAPSTKATSKQSIREVSPRAIPPAANHRKPYCAEKELLDTIESFLSPPLDSVETTCQSTNPLLQEFQDLAKSPNQINFAIAIVPDPVHTHLSLFFDRTIDAIQQGAEQAGWIFDRATMPWENQEHPESTDFLIRLQQGQYQDDREDLPGLMIFRPADPANFNTSLFVFVVGEVPTGGINKEQFRTAVNLIGIAAEAGSPLRIIGPTFSGSLYSLAQLLRDKVNRAPPGRFGSTIIRSGTVSSWGTTQWFTNCWPDYNELHADFATFQQSDKYMLRRFLEFEGRRGYTADRIAVLAEDETAYGNREVPPSGLACPQEHSTSDESDVLQLYFPRDISQLRSAYQQGFAQSSSSTDSYQVRSTLPLNLQDSGSDDDTVQQYAHSQTPLSQESILLGIIAAIREHHIQFVVLKATNPMDAVFLSGFLKQGYSEARVVAMPADLLLSRDADDVSLLHGVMALTTYSLLPGIDDQVAIPDSLPDSRVGHIFPSAYAVGTFNATLSQIACIEQPSQAGCDGKELPVARYAEYGWPLLGPPRDLTKPLAPVVWLTVLGRSGFWPLGVLEDGSYHAGEIESSPKAMTRVGSVRAHFPKYREFPPWPLFWKIVGGIVLMMAVLYWLLLWKGSILASSSPMTLLAPVKDRCRSALIVLIGWLLLAAMLLLVWPCVAWWGAWRTSPMLYTIAAAIAALIHCGVCVRELNRRGPGRDSRIFVLVAAALVVCFVLLYKVPGHSQNPFLYRYIHLTSGVSPLLPFLCLLAAGLWWAWFSLSGLALVDRRRPQLPHDGDLPDIGPSGHIAPSVMRLFWPTEEFVKKLVDVVRPCAWDSRIYIPMGIFLGILLCALNYRHPLLSLETGHFEWVYAISLAVVTFALFATLFRLLVIWLECRKILATLDRFPLRRAFAELNFNMEPFWRAGGGQTELSRFGSRQLETLGQLSLEVTAASAKAESEASRQEAAGLLKDLRETTTGMDDIRRRFADSFRERDSVAPVGRPVTPVESGSRSETPLHKPLTSGQGEFEESCINSYELAQKNIAHACAKVLRYLQPQWRGKEGLIVREAGSKDDDKNITVMCCKDNKDKTEPSLSTRLAERFVALVYLNFILSVLLRIRTLAMAALGLYIFLLISVNSYPFEPKVTLRSVAILMLMFVVGVVGYVSAQVHRDSILSLVTQTKPGELGLAFWLRMGTFVALPLLSLLVSQFPTLNNALFSWLEPAVGALGK